MNIARPLSLLLCAGALAMVPTPFGMSAADAAALGQSDDPAPVTADERAIVVEQLAGLLEERYVFADVGHQYAAALRGKLAAGAYDDLTDVHEFSRQLTRDMREVSRDRHLRVGYRPPRDDEGERPRMGMPGPDYNGLTRSGWLADGVAYMRYDAFPGNETTLEATRAALADYAGAESLIIDARAHRGGFLSEMDILFAELFADPQDLVIMQMREAVASGSGAPMLESARNGDVRLRETDAPDGLVYLTHYTAPATGGASLADTKVYLLTSKGTFSAGEHLSLVLKRTGRATLVGEATGGGAHFGGGELLGTRFGTFIPHGRTFDPDTGESWEGTGVAPDIEVEREDALAEVLRLEGVEADAETLLAALD
ncbi:S41 family peptidase [Sphingomicrobium sediminis]|uniref:S41 family peptidase n=1 Tax=Sphingomicrobium sediminis TaxID=2950949 RepID=A0A9X2EMZ7_9SPHN|nr:S41 family peptidase [Sphingomicrobium sediminis]MCM8558394.1 S41 family peptidase [Sphingomicrobium sediminis]